MIPAEIAVICLLLFILYQSVMGWLTRGKFEKELKDQKGEIDELTRRLGDAEANLIELDLRTRPKK
jgi:hypothetical protein